MAGKNDIITSMGLSTDDFKTGMDEVFARLDKLETKSEKASKKVSEVGKSLKQAFGAAALAAGISDAIKSFNQVERKAGDVDEAFIAMGESGQSAWTKLKQGGAKFLAGAASALSFGATKPLTDEPKKQAVDEQRINRELKTQAETYDEITSKVRRLQDLRETEMAKSGGGRSPELTKQIKEFTDKAALTARNQTELLGDTSAGSEQRIALNKVEIEQEQKKADLANKLRDLGGNRTAADLKAFRFGIDLADAEAARKKKSIELGEVQEKTATNLNEIAAETSIKFDDQINLQREKIAANDVEVKKAEELYGVHSLVASQLRLQGHELKLAATEMQQQRDIALHAAQDAVDIKDAELAGNKRLADLEKNRVQYAEQIREAKRHGNDELAEQLRKQQRLNELEIKAADYRKTPQQRRDERREQEKQDLAIRHINAMEKNNPNSVPADGRNHVSPAAAKARAEFAARHALPLAAVGKNDAKDIRANTIIVTTLKSS